MADGTFQAGVVGHGVEGQDTPQAAATDTHVLTITRDSPGGHVIDILHQLIYGETAPYPLAQPVPLQVNAHYPKTLPVQLEQELGVAAGVGPCARNEKDGGGVIFSLVYIQMQTQPPGDDVFFPDDLCSQG
jgi:hypothetical protein